MYNNFNGLIVSLKSVIYSSGNYLVLVIDDGSKDAASLEEMNKEMEENFWLVVK